MRLKRLAPGDFANVARRMWAMGEARPARVLHELSRGVAAKEGAIRTRQRQGVISHASAVITNAGGQDVLQTGKPVLVQQHSLLRPGHAKGGESFRRVGSSGSHGRRILVQVNVHMTVNMGQMLTGFGQPGADHRGEPASSPYVSLERFTNAAITRQVSIGDTCLATSSAQPVSDRDVRSSQGRMVCPSVLLAGSVNAPAPVTGTGGCGRFSGRRRSPPGAPPR